MGAGLISGLLGAVTLLTRIPVRRRAVASPQPTTAGIPYSRAMIEACAAGLPTSVTTAAARVKSGVQAGAVIDTGRIEFLRAYIGAMDTAASDGVDVRGYFIWSLLDNFEWGHGYTKRFGIVAVDFESQQRVPKPSARFYADVIRTNGHILG